MDVAQDLRSRQAMLRICIELLWKAGKVSDAHETLGVSKAVYGVGVILTDMVDEFDQALAAFSGKMVRNFEVEMVCTGCGTISNVDARLNILMQGEGESLALECDCGKEIGHYRSDPAGIPNGYSLTISSVLGAKRENATVNQLRERMAEIATTDVTDVNQLPDIEELRIGMLIELPPIAICHMGTDPKLIKIREQLAAGRAQIAKTGLVTKLPNDF